VFCLSVVVSFHVNDSCIECWSLSLTFWALALTKELNRPHWTLSMTLASTLHRKVRTLRIFESSRGRGDVVPNSSRYWYLPIRTGMLSMTLASSVFWRSLFLSWN
jgi:hypothetical protein